MNEYKNTYTHHPAKDDHQRKNTERDLSRRTNGHAQRDFHFVLHGKGNGSPMFAGVADNGDENNRDEGARQSP